MSKAVFVSSICVSLMLAHTARSQSLNDDFESYNPGELPGSPWLDITSRIDNPTIPSPSALVVDTVGPDGSPTKAVQIVDAIGTSSGILTEIAPADRHVMRMDVRIDQFSDASGTWPGGIGFLQDEGAADFNGDPQAVLYAWQDRRWHLFIKNAPAGSPTGIDMLITGAPRIRPGAWYTLELTVNTQTGDFDASVFDAASGDLLGQRLYSFPNWDPQYGTFDALAAFDGEGGASGGTVGGVSTYDNVSYIPAPSAAALAAIGLMMTRLRVR
ncbi:MAG: hypothetical protein Phyf2KO_13440 [Phycisphaerales bacterium]